MRQRFVPRQWWQWRPLTGEILCSKNPNLLLPPASTAKLLTAILAIEHRPLSNVVTISRNAAKIHPSKAGFREGDRVSIEGLLYAALLKSANDAAVALAEAVAGSEEQFVLLMNDKALSIGATATKFINATGLPGPDQHITALDLSTIMRYAIKNPTFREIVATPVAQISTEAGKTFASQEHGQAVMDGSGSHWRKNRVYGQRKALFRMRCGTRGKVGGCGSSRESEPEYALERSGVTDQRSLWKDSAREDPGSQSEKRVRTRALFVLISVSYSKNRGA